MELFHRRRRISQMFEGKILPPVLRVLKARTRGLGHLYHMSKGTTTLPRCGTIATAIASLWCREEDPNPMTP
jgi:hypothetical protein